MKCLLCDNQTKSIGRKYCSRYCYEKSKIGRKRPDVTKRNKTNNPVWNKESREKMQQSLTGKKQSADQKLKRSVSLKWFYNTHPRARERLAKNVWDKYTSKIAGTGWRKIRLRVLERDNYTCQKCGKIGGTSLIVHHIDWKGKQRGVSQKEMNNNLDNLTTLCHKCHNGIHRHKANDYQSRKSQIAP